MTARDASPTRLTVRVGLMWSPFDRDAVPSPLFWEAVEAMDADGWDSLWLSDPGTRPGPAPLAALAAVAARTTQLKLGTSVLIVPPRQPVLLAKELATLDALSGGRFLPAFGLGVDAPFEVAALGVAREERVARLEEAMTVLRLLWSGEPVTWQGRFTQLEGLALTPVPQRRKLEIWLGGASAPALRRVGRCADGWLASFSSPAMVGAGIAAIRAAAADAGRSIDDDHYGAIVFAADTPADLPPLESLGANVPAGLRPAEHMVVGAEPLLPLLRRFRAEGASKLVVVPLARPARLLAFLRELKQGAVDEFEATA